MGSSVEFEIKVKPTGEEEEEEGDNFWFPRSGCNKRVKETVPEEIVESKRSKSDVDRRMGVRKGGGKVVPVCDLIEVESNDVDILNSDRDILLLKFFFQPFSSVPLIV